MNRIKRFFLNKIFKNEIREIEGHYRKNADNDIRKIRFEADQKNALLAEIRRVFVDKNDCILAIEENKRGREVIVTKRISYDSIWFMLYGVDYRAINCHPRIMATFHDGYDNNESYIVIDDILVEDNNIGNGSILMKYFIDYCKSTSAGYIKGMLSSVDKDHFDRSIHFYEKYGFVCKLNTEKSDGSIRLDLRCP